MHKYLQQHQQKTYNLFVLGKAADYVQKKISTKRGI